MKAKFKVTGIIDRSTTKIVDKKPVREELIMVSLQPVDREQGVSGLNLTLKKSDFVHGQEYEIEFKISKVK